LREHYLFSLGRSALSRIYVVARGISHSPRGLHSRWCVRRISGFRTKVQHNVQSRIIVHFRRFRKFHSIRFSNLWGKGRFFLSEADQELHSMPEQKFLLKLFTKFIFIKIVLKMIFFIESMKISNFLNYLIFIILFLTLWLFWFTYILQAVKIFKM